MTVIKQYNPGTSAWETVLVGAPGPAGPPLNWLQLTQAAYDALAVKDPAVLYVIIG